MRTTIETKNVDSIIKSNRKENDYLDYTIIEDVTFMIRNVSYIPPKEFKNRWLHIYPEKNIVYIKVSKGYSWDNITGFPDTPSVIVGSLVEDALSQFSIEIRNTWKDIDRMQMSYLIELAFLEVMLYFKRPKFIAYLYYHMAMNIMSLMFPNIKQLVK
jgi:hypothetical protein